MALENEIDTEKSLEKTPDPDGLVPLFISCDMQLLKRGKASDSLTWHTAIMGSKTKQTSLATLVQITCVVSVKVLHQKIKNQLIITASKIAK